MAKGMSHDSHVCLEVHARGWSDEDCIKVLEEILATLKKGSSYDYPKTADVRWNHGSGGP
ncbi:MAG: hypothetical protein QNJ62_06580 [Methyloceanibacter sp.]|nr:hypothetical protein [Methyloceanibacter sp.]